MQKRVCFTNGEKWETIPIEHGDKKIVGEELIELNPQEGLIVHDGVTRQQQKGIGVLKTKRYNYAYNGKKVKRVPNGLHIENVYLKPKKPIIKKKLKTVKLKPIKRK